jgi:hypothetical protein
LYPGKHRLDIKQNGETYDVDLNIKLKEA